MSGLPLLAVRVGYCLGCRSRCDVDCRASGSGDRRRESTGNVLGRLDVHEFPSVLEVRKKLGRVADEVDSSIGGSSHLLALDCVKLIEDGVVSQ